MYKLTFVAILIFLVGCSDFGKTELKNEINLLKTQVEEKNKELKRCKSIKTDIENLKEKTQTVAMSSLQVLKNLERLDENIYDGRYLKNLRSQSPKPETMDIVQGYQSLIYQIELDLKK